MPSASDADYYRSRSHRDQIHHSSTHSHQRDRASPPLDRRYSEEERPRAQRARSPYSNEDRWTPREKLAQPSHSTYVAPSYDDGYSRRPVEDHYHHVTAYPEDAWPSHHTVKERDTYTSAAYHSWDRPAAYGHPPEREERARQHHLQQPHASHSRHAYDWPEDNRMKPPADRAPEEREWTRRDERTWPREEETYVRDDSHRPTARGWESRAAYPPEPPTSKTSEPKFAPGPGWKGEDNFSSTRTNHKELWREKGKYEGKKKNKNHGENRNHKDHDHRGRDNGFQNKK